MENKINLDWISRFNIFFFPENKIARASKYQNVSMIDIFLW